MAYILGEAALRVTPNMENFHNKLKNHPQFKSAEAEKIEILVKLDDKQFEKDLKEIERKLRDLDSDPIDILVRADTSSAARSLTELRIREEMDSIDLRVRVNEKSMENSQRAMNDFKDGNEYIETHLLINRNHADDEMEDIRQKAASKPIIQNIIYKTNQMPTMPSPDARRQSQDLLNSRELNRVQQQGWNVVNMWGKMWNKMNDQIEKGIIDIYDPYRQTAARIGTAMIKPFQNMNAALQESDSFTSFFRSLRTRFGRASKDADGFFSRFKQGLAGFVINTSASFSNIGAAWGKLRSEWQSGGFFKKVIYEAKQLGSLMGGWVKKGFRAIGGMFRTVGARISQAFAPLRAELGRMWQVLKTDGLAALKVIGGGFVSLGRKVLPGLGTELKKMWVVLKTEGAAALRIIGNGLKALPGLVYRGIKGIGPAISRGFSRINQITGGFFSRLGNNFMSIGRFAGTTFKNIGKIVSPALRGVAGMANRVLFKTMRSGFNLMGRYASGFGRIAIGTFAKVAGVLMAAVMPSIMAVVAGLGAMAGAAVIGGILALGGALLSVAQGALLMAPALLAAAGLSFAALKVGLEGVGEGVKAAFSAETVEDFEDAIAKLPAGAQEIARAFRESKGAMDDLKESVQTALTRDLGPSIRTMMDNIMPRLHEGMTNMAASWNNSIRGAMDELGSEDAGRGLDAIMGGMTEMSKEMEPVLQNLIKAFGSLLEQGSAFMKPMGTWFANASEGFANWAEGLKEIDEISGKSKFDTKMEAAATNAKYLGDIFGGLFRTIGNVFAAGAEGGGGMLAGMANSMQTLADYTSRGNEGWDKMVEFMGAASRAASQLGDILAPVFGIVMDLGYALFSLGEGALPGVASLAQGIASAMDPIKEAAGPFGEIMGMALSTLTPLAEELGNILAPLIVGLGGGVGQMIAGFGGLTAAIAPQISSLASSFAPLLVSVGAGIGDIFMALQPYMESTLVVLEALMGPLQAVFDYIGKIAVNILDALSPLVTGHDAALKALLGNLMPIINALGEGLMGAIDALKPALKAIGDGFNSIIEAVAPLLPIIGEALSTAFGMIIDVITWLTPLIPPLVDVVVKLAEAGIKILISHFTWLVGVVQEYWPAISETINNAIQNVILPLIERLSDFIINTLIPIIMDLWENTVHPTFQAIGDFIGVAINQVIIPVFNVLMGVIKNVLAPLFWWLVDHVITPVFNLFKSIIKGAFDFINWAINNIVTPALDTLGKVFQAAVNGIKSVWDGIKKVFADPIKFFIDTVINGAVIKGWNAVMGFINMDDAKIDEVKVDPGIRMATGGVLPGYTPGRDVHDFYSPTGGSLHLSGGEAIMRPEWTQAVGGPRAVARMNEDARHGRIRKPGLSKKERERLNKQHSHAQGGVFDLGHFASGGVLQAMEAIVGAKYPELVPMYSGYRAGGPYHGTYQAGDFSNGMDNTPAQNALAHDIAETYPGSAELIYEMPGFDRQINNGAYVGAGGGSYGFYVGAGNHRNHVHWAMTTPPTMPFGGGVFEGGSGGGGGIGGFLYSGVTRLIKEFFSPIADKIAGAVADVGHYGKLVTGMGKNLVTNATQALKAKVTELIPGWMRGGSDDAGNHPYDLSAGAEQWRAGVIAAFERQGENPTEERVNALLRQIQSESTGNPNAVQNIVDVNGTGPSAGMGLYQFIPSTWAGYRDPGLPNDRTDPDAAHNAAVRYFRDRHGWNTGPGGVGRGHGWKTGGVLPEFFDKGGEADGTGFMEKRTLHPERVLSPNQTRAFNMLVYGLMPEMIADYKRRPFDLETGVNRLLKGWGQIQAASDKSRDTRINVMSNDIKKTFEAREAGEIKLNPVDLNIDEGWYDRNNEALADNLAKAVNGAQLVSIDPWGYLEAEERAKERIDAEKEAEREAAEEKRKEEEEKLKEEQDQLDKEKKEEEDKARREREKLEDEAATTDEAKEALKAQREAAKEAEQEAKKEKDQAKREKDQAAKKAEDDRKRAEDERIAKLKETGEYYYGYKVFGEGASNPNAYEASESEKSVMATLDALASPLGLAGPWGKISEKIPVMQELGAAIETATPAWMAAINGDPSGLMHNIAVSQAAAYEQREEELKDLGPGAVAGLMEMALSRSNVSDSQPFIGELHQHGMSDAEFAQRMEYWEAKRARQKTGTIRTR